MILQLTSLLFIGIMLDKKTVLIQKYITKSDESKLDNFKSCLERVDKLSVSNDNLQSCIKKILKEDESER